MQYFEQLNWAIVWWWTSWLHFLSGQGAGVTGWEPGQNLIPAQCASPLTDKEVGRLLRRYPLPCPKPSALPWGFRAPVPSRLPARPPPHSSTPRSGAADDRPRLRPRPSRPESKRTSRTRGEGARGWWETAPVRTETQRSLSVNTNISGTHTRTNAHSLAKKDTHVSNECLNILYFSINSKFYQIMSQFYQDCPRFRVIRVTND